jgi:hypothetical protein
MLLPRLQQPSAPLQPQRDWCSIQNQRQTSLNHRSLAWGVLMRAEGLKC